MRIEIRFGSCTEHGARRCIAGAQSPITRDEGHQRVSGLLEQGPVPRLARFDGFVGTLALGNVTQHGACHPAAVVGLCYARVQPHPDDLAVASDEPQLAVARDTGRVQQLSVLEIDVLILRQNEAAPRLFDEGTSSHPQESSDG